MNPAGTNPSKDLKPGFVNFALQKLAFAESEVRKLLHSDFPHTSTRESLRKVLTSIEAHKSRIGRKVATDTENAASIESCRDANRFLARLLPLLGFVLRSTNVRNPFETHEPVQQLCRQFLGNSTSLIMSAEWEFSPLTYAKVFSEIPDFVLIGMPASEAENVLVLPLVGHEIAHTIWKQWKLSRYLEKDVENAIKAEITARAANFSKLFPDFDAQKFATDIFFIKHFGTCQVLTTRQCEEVFCDLVGIRTFGSSYLDAFEYLIAPAFGPRSERYLDMVDRATILREASERWNLKPRTNYEKSFVNTPRNDLDDKNLLLLEVVDRSTRALVPKLTTLAEDFCHDAEVKLPRDDAISKCLSENMLNRVNRL